MKLQALSSKKLNAALQKVQKCISGKNAIAIHSEVLLSKKNGEFFFTAASQTAQLTVPAPIELVDGKFEEALALPIKRMIPFIATLPDVALIFDITDNSVFSIEYCTEEKDNVKEGKVTMTYQPGEDFPLLVSSENMSKSISMPASAFMDVLTRTVLFCANEELRRIMNNICLDLSDDCSALSVVATDGIKLVKSSYDNKKFTSVGQAGKILIDRANVRILSVFSDVIGNVSIKSDDSNIIVTDEDGRVEFICKMMEGKYPNYDSVIPRELSSHIDIEKKEVVEVIKRVMLFSSEESRVIVLEKKGMFAVFRSQDIDYSLAAEDQAVILAGECEEGLKIGLNSYNLLTAIEAVPGDVVRLYLNNESHPVIITSDAAAREVLTLVMPMKI